MADWPVSLPQKPGYGTWTTQPQSNRAIFQPEVGDPIQRRRSTAVAHIAAGTFKALSSAQVNTFETFYADTLFDGTDAFTWDDPITGTNYEWKFAADGYSITDLGNDKYDLRVSLVRVPA